MIVFMQQLHQCFALAGHLKSIIDSMVGTHCTIVVLTNYPMIVILSPGGALLKMA
jgi:hypothetical protein